MNQNQNSLSLSDSRCQNSITESNNFESDSDTQYTKLTQYLQSVEKWFGVGLMDILNWIFLKYGNNVWPGDVTIESEEDAYRYQIKIEDSFQKQLGFRLKTGDIIMTHFDTILTNNNKKQKGRRKSKIFER